MLVGGWVSKTRARGTCAPGDGREAAVAACGRFCAIVGVVVCAVACGDAPRYDRESERDDPIAEPATDAVLVEIHEAIGIVDDPDPWPDGTFLFPEITGVGVGLFDADGDDDLDLLRLRVPPPGHPDRAAPNRMYFQEDGTFRDVTETVGLDDPGFAQGVAVGDVDNDGDPDVYFANYGPDAFWENDGGVFRDRTSEAGLGDPAWSSAATFCDYDLDGLLDLYVVRYVRLDRRGSCRAPSGIEDYCGPGSFSGHGDVLYRNRGDGTFEDVTARAGIVGAAGGERAKGLGVVCVDLTGDGRPDFYVANDGEANQLWVAAADGTFRDEAVARGVAVNRNAKPEASMGLAIGDVDDDGYLDVLSTHLRDENNTIWAGSAHGFTDRTLETGMAADDRPWTGFGCVLFDLEHDGDLDLAVVNGAVSLPGPRVDRPFWDRYSEPNLLFVNDGDGRFEPAPALAGRFAERRELTRGLASGDLDRDGDLDLVVSNGDGSLRIYRNDAPAADTHWVAVRAVTGSRDALGARVAVDAGGRVAVGTVLANASYQSVSEPRAHFGLGATDSIDGIEVTWPDGTRERFAGGAADRVVLVRRGEGSPP